MLRAVNFAILICAVQCARVQVQNTVWQLDLDTLAALEPELKQSPCEFASKHKTTVFGWTQGTGAFTDMQKTLNELAKACAQKASNDQRIEIAQEQIALNQALVPGLEVTRATRLSELKASEDPVVEEEPADKECKLALAHTSNLFKNLWKEFKYKISKLWYAIKAKFGKASDHKHLDSNWDEWTMRQEVMKAFAPFCQAKKDHEAKLASLASYKAEEEKREAQVEEFEADIVKAQNEAKETFAAQIKEIEEALAR